MQKIIVICFTLFTCLVVEARLPVKEIPGFGRSALGIQPLTVTLNDRTACLNGKPFGEQPLSRGNTTAQVNNLILEMTEMQFDAYIIPSADAHQSEYPPAADARRTYISGLTGSAGTAVVLSDGRRALWTDSRYHLQADDQMDCLWLLMKSGQSGVPTISEWIISSVGNESLVSADARLIDTSSWLDFEGDFIEAGIVFTAETISNGNNIVDVVWNDDGRPSYRLDPAFIHGLQYAGVSWEDKVDSIVAEMETKGADVLVLSMLDETAWILNLRGTDIDYNPYFRSYIIIDNSGGEEPSLVLYVPDADVKIPEDVKEHLLIDQCEVGHPCVSLGNYDLIGDAVSDIATNANGIWMTSGLSYYIYSSAPSNKIIYETSPVMLMKAMKNDVEKEGMKNAYIRDAVAIIACIANLESDIINEIYRSELDISVEVENYRKVLDLFMGSSFEAISAFGPNGAIVHYSPSAESNLQITDRSLFLLDSGGQYLDGTTDTTRTYHFGTPSVNQMEKYTLVLQGLIDYASAVFPVGTSKSYIDILARQHLYRRGLDFGHGVSHGIGAFLGVHEGGDSIFENGFHQSDEPGYYEDGYYGIRIENVLAVIEADTEYDYIPKSYQFETLTLVPFEPKLINTSLLTRVQCAWINAYYQRIRDEVGPELLIYGYIEEHAWMIIKTQEIVC